MVRRYKKLNYWNHFSTQQIASGLVGAIFVLYIGFVIMTPKTEVIQNLEINGRNFRLCKTYYETEPLLKIDTRSGIFRKTIFIESGDKKLATKNPKLQIDSDSKRHNLVNDCVSVWQLKFD